MKTIHSLTNPLVKEVVKLHVTKYRTQLRKFIAEGTRTCSALIQYGHKSLTLFSTEAMLAAATQLAEPKTIFVVSDAVMQKMSPSSSPSGILGIFAIPSLPAPTKLEPGLVLARVADPGNMGTLIRSAVSMGKKTVVTIEGTDPWGPKAVHASAGAIGTANIVDLSWQELVETSNRPPLCALVVEGGKQPSELALANMLLVVGSEAHGIPAEWLASCQERMTLPMPGSAESLNAAVAGSIALYLAR